MIVFFVLVETNISYILLYVLNFGISSRQYTSTTKLRWLDLIFAEADLILLNLFIYILISNSICAMSTKHMISYVIDSLSKLTDEIDLFPDVISLNPDLVRKKLFYRISISNILIIATRWCAIYLLSYTCYIRHALYLDSEVNDHKISHIYFPLLALQEQERETRDNMSLSIILVSFLTN